MNAVADQLQDAQGSLQKLPSAIHLPSSGENDADAHTIDVKPCGLCGGYAFQKDHFKSKTLRPVAQVT
ncbi:MAG: hypothetical protein JO121_12325 [Deltaproteobacteria bacterium]|jgi:hypothetical protein|nr:hypothetical protein [Deltaproteobacteria bacterium]